MVGKNGIQMLKNYYGKLIERLFAQIERLKIHKLQNKPSCNWEFVFSYSHIASSGIAV